MAQQSFPVLRLDLGDLRLRPFGDRDIEAIVDACSDPLSQHWLPLPTPYTEADAAFFVAAAEDFRRTGSGLRCAIARSEDDALVAGVSANRTDWTARVTDVGYWARPAHRGQGVVTRSVQALSLWLLDHGMERIQLQAAPGNEASNRVAVAAGFTFEGTLRNAGYIHAGRVDLNLYSLIRADRAMTGG